MRVRLRGFTLIELLVVIVIIGILVTMATLSMGVLGRDNEIEDQAKRLHAVLTQAREEAELQGRDFGLRIERDGYLFLHYDHALRQWQPLEYDDLFAYRALPAGLQFRLWLDGREVILKTYQEDQAMFSSTSTSSSSSASSVQISADPASTTGAGVRPQVAVLSSGDLLPFELQLARDGNDFNWRVIGKADNTLDIESGSSTR